MARIAKSAQDNQKKWEDRIARAKKVRQDWKDTFRVDMAREYLDGKQKPPETPQNEWITINKLYSHLKSQLPALYNADPYFYVKLRKSYSVNPMNIALWEKRGEIRQAYLNYLKDELELKIKARLCIQDAFFSYGIMKIYYHAERIKNENVGRPIYDDNARPVIGENGEIMTEPEYYPTNERYCIERVHPDDFLWGEDSGPLEGDWPWIAQCEKTTREELEKDSRYNRSALKRLKPHGEITSDDDRKKREERKKGGDVAGKSDLMDNKKEPSKVDTIYKWEIYDLKNKKWTVIAENGDIPLIDEEALPPGVEKHCYAILRFTLRDDSPYPIPPLSQGIDPQKEYNMARSMILTHRKRFNRKYEVDVSNLSDSQLELPKLELGGDGTIIKKNSPQQAVIPIQDAPLDQMRYLEINMLNMDLIELMGGTHDESRGIAGAESATQAGILDKRLEMKEGDALSMVIDFARKIARKLDQLVKTHITKDEAVKITGGPRGEFWEIVRARDYEDIEGEYDFNVNVGATIPRLPQMERSQWLAFLQLLANFPHLMLQKHLMKKMAEFHHIEDDIMIEEFYQLGRQIMAGMMPMPGKTGSQPGQSETKPASVTGGQVGGPMSLMMPMAGNAPT